VVVQVWIGAGSCDFCFVLGFGKGVHNLALPGGGKRNVSQLHATLCARF
jgi:hypothetical protein